MPAIGNGIGVGFGGFSWSSYWKQHSKVLFFAFDCTGILNKVSGGKIYNQKSGSTDYLTIASGTGLDTVYQTPDTAAYKSADTDYCWWKVNATRSTSDGNRLIAYDFTRTIVWYDDNPPSTILGIMILSSDLSAAEEDRASRDFYLSVFWDGTLNLNGYVKSNKPLAQKYTWTAESVYSTEVTNYNNALAVKLSTTQLDLLDAMVVGLKSDLSITNLSDYFDQILIYANETEEAALRNLVQNSYHATNHSATFTQYDGFVGDGAATYVDTGFNPSGFPGNFKQNSGAVGMCSRTKVMHVTNSPSHGSQSAGSIKIGITPYRSDTPSISARVWANQNTEHTINWGSTNVGYSMVNRTGANNIFGFRNKTKSADGSIASSSSVLNGTLCNCAYRGSAGVTGFNTQPLSIWFVSKGMSDAEQGKIVDRLEAYMDGHSKGVI